MQTNRWIDLLASQAEPVAARGVAPLMLRALPWGLAGAVAIMLTGYGLRHDPPNQFMIARLKSAFFTIHDRAQNAAGEEGERK